MAQLKSFLVLADQRHMTRAARLLNLTQPAVSTQLRKLEEALGQALFHRSRRGLELTEAGRVFWRYANDALVRLEDGRKEVARLSGLEAGSLAIGGGATATTYLLPRLLGRFHARHSAIRITLREQGSRTIIDAVLAGELDLGIVTIPLSPSSGQLATVPWVIDELRLLLPPGHLLEGAAGFTWADLAGAPLVLFEAGTAVRQLIDARLEHADITPDIVMELRSIESIKQMVAQGIGAGFVSRFALGTDNPGLRCADGQLTRQLAVVFREDRPLNPAGQAFLEMLLEVDAAAAFEASTPTSQPR